MHAQRHARCNDTFKHLHEVTFPVNDFEITFPLAARKIRHTDTVVHHMYYSTHDS